MFLPALTRRNAEYVVSLHDKSKDLGGLITMEVCAYPSPHLVNS